MKCEKKAHVGNELATKILLPNIEFNFVAIQNAPPFTQLSNSQCPELNKSWIAFFTINSSMLNVGYSCMVEFKMRNRNEKKNREETKKKATTKNKRTDTYKLQWGNI